MRTIGHISGIATKTLPLVFAIAAAAHGASAQKNETVAMPRFEVAEARGYFDFKIRYDDKTERVEELKLTWVSAAAHKTSLRVGDRLVSLDGIPVDQLTYEDAIERLKRELKAGESRVLVFTRTHLFRRVTVTHTSKAPATVPEPPPSAAAPTDLSEPRQP
jgi:predicted metalloprotease with PDZ domain